ncbi:hypothetical protein IJ182_06775 [bacterium]|nr:hypothetical protein [bacterium]
MNISPISFNKSMFENKNKLNVNQNMNSTVSSQNKRSKKLAKIATGSALILMLTKSLNSSAQQMKTIDIKDTNNAFCITEYSPDYTADPVIPNAELINVSDYKPYTPVNSPAPFDYIEATIATKMQKMKNQNLTEEEKVLLKENIKALQLKREEQNAVANMYSDGNDLYIQIDIKDNAPEKIKERYKFGINIESLKKLFDIQDGAIENNNNIDARWELTDNHGNGYYDYTHNWFRTGDSIVVPLNEVNLDNINIDSYL